MARQLQSTLKPQNSKLSILIRDRKNDCSELVKPAQGTYQIKQTERNRSQQQQMEI
jgi:hypothetical protein